MSKFASCSTFSSASSINLAERSALTHSSSFKVIETGFVRLPSDSSAGVASPVANCKVSRRLKAVRMRLFGVSFFRSSSEGRFPLGASA